MNIVKKRDILYKFESIWKTSKNDTKKDYNGVPYPWPIKNKFKWQNQDVFLEKLKKVELYLIKKRMYSKYDKKKHCVFHDKNNITSKMFIIDNICWDNGLCHYIEKHNIKPSDDFIDFIF